VLALSYDEEDSLRNVGLIILMYFTYCQLWIYVVVKAWYAEWTARGEKVWDKTERFEVQPQRKSDGS
jgi:hypothetical protein